MRTLTPSRRATTPPRDARRLGAAWLVGVVGVVVLAGCRPVVVPKCSPNDPVDHPSYTGCVVDRVDLVGVDAIPASELEGRLATAESSHPLGGALASVPILGILDRRSADYERFDRFVLERDLARVERAYRARGHYDARVRAGRVTKLANGHVRVEIVVVEGAPVTVAAVDLAWKDWCPTDKALGRVTKAVTDAKNELATGAPFTEEAFEATRRSIQRAMVDRGFAYATVEKHADVDLAQRTALVSYTIELGPRTRFGPISFDGLVDKSGEALLRGGEPPLRRALGFERGEPYSVSALESAQYTLTDFGVFSSIEILPPDPAKRPPSLAKACDARPDVEVPVVVRVEVAKLRTVKLGIGAEAGWQVEGHGVAGWEDRNFVGGLRHFVAEAKGGPVLYPTRLDTLFSAPPSRILPQLKLRSELSQPLPWRTTAHFEGSFNLYRLQPTTGSTDASRPVYDLDLRGPTLTKFEPNIIGYREYTGRTGLDRSFTKLRHYLGLFYNMQLFSPFSYNEPEPPTGYSNVLVPYAQLIGTLDFRTNGRGKPDRIHPRSGALLSVDAQLASGAAQNANDARLRPEIRGYVAISKRVTLASRLAFGFLFPQNYGADLSGGNASSPAECHDLQLLQLRGFFSGGPYSNRGYGYNEVGPHVTATCSAQVSTVNQSTSTGGLSMWEASAELRIPLGESLGTALFLDGSDVTGCEGLVRFTHPHLSTGLGLRYDTPVGPLRADVGWRIPGAQALDAKRACARDLPDFEPAPVFGLPIAVSVAIGEAF